MVTELALDFGLVEGGEVEQTSLGLFKKSSLRF